MEFDFIETDIFYEPAYWILTGGCILALLIGFRLELFTGSFTGSENSMGFLANTLVKVFIILCIPIISYVIVWKMR